MKNLITTPSKLTNDSFLKAEEVMNIQFPDSFIDFWSKYDGGEPIEKTFLINDEPWICTRIKTLKEIIESWSFTKEIFMSFDKKIFCIGETLGSSVICISYSNIRESGHIFLFDFGSETCVYLSDNIENFITSLK